MSALEQQKIQQLLAAALECSFYLSPNDPGLTWEELAEVGKQASLQPGEIADVLPMVTTRSFGRPRRLLPNKNGSLLHWHLFMHPEEPEYRDVEAFRFLYMLLDESRRANGAANVRLERSMIIEKAALEKLSREKIEVAIAINIFTDVLVEEEGIIRPKQPRTSFGDPAAPLTTLGNRSPFSNEGRRRAYPLVKDVIERRTDGRPAAAEPLDAFAAELEKLGHGAFRLWWMQIVAEMRRADIQTAPVSATVLAAALVEGSLAFVVKHAKALNLGVLGSKTFDGPPTSWAINDLVSSAAAGRDSAILDLPTRQRAEGLIRSRQRIHAGRMLAEFPGGPPDLRPDDARDAKATADKVVRSVLDWLQRYPPA